MVWTYGLISLTESQTCILLNCDSMTCVYLSEETDKRQMNKSFIVSLAGNVIWSVKNRLTKNACEHVTSARPAAGDQLFLVCPRMHGHSETNSCFQRPFHLSQIVRNGPKQNIQNGSVSHVGVYFVFNDMLDKERLHQYSTCSLLF